MKSKFLLHLLFLASILLSSCGPSAGSAGTSSEVQAWLDQPVTGATLPLAPFTLKAHARHSAGSGISKIVFLVNSVPVATVETDATQPIVYAEAGWNPAATGLYQIQSQAFAGDAFNYSDIAFVCVSAEVKEASLSFTPECEGALPSAPETDTTKIDITPTPGLPLDIKLGATPSPVYYGTCTTEPTVLTFTLTPTSEEGVANFYIKYVLIDSSGVTEVASASIFIPAAGLAEYSTTVDVNALAAPYLGGSAGFISAYVYSFDAANNELGFKPFDQVQVLACQNQNIPATQDPQAPPTATNTPQQNQPPVQNDTTAPLIDPSLSTYDAFYGNGCVGTILTITAYVEDASGIASVTLGYGYIGAGAEGIFLPMSSVGGNNYQASIDVGNEAYTFFQGANGQIAINIEALDNAGNTASETDGPVNVSFCPG